MNLRYAMQKGFSNHANHTFKTFSITNIFLDFVWQKFWPCVIQISTITTFYLSEESIQ